MNSKEKVDELFNKNIKLVYHLVSKYYGDNERVYAHYGIEKQDAIQAGLIGLFKASKNYDEKTGNKFATFASKHILSSVNSNIRDYSMIKMPRLSKSIASKIKKKLERNPNLVYSIEDIMEEYECSKYHAEIAHDILNSFSVISLDTSIDNDAENSKKDIFVQDAIHSNFNLEEAVIDKERYERFMSKLSQRERDIIFYINRNLPQREVAAIVGISQVQVSRFYKKAIQKLEGMRDREELLSV